MNHKGTNTQRFTKIVLWIFVSSCLCGLLPAQTSKQFRVCADPENFPFSNRQQEGFENKIANVIAKELGATPSYVWWGQRRGFVRNTMNASIKDARCDVMISVPAGY